MQLNSLIISSFTVLTAISALPAIESNTDLQRRQIPNKPCSHLTGGLHVIAASGDGQQNVGQYGLIGSLAGSILAAIPGSTNVTLAYDKGSPDGVGKTTQGSANLLRYITDYHTACPNTRIALLGYSAGGIIAMNALCGASPDPWTSPTQGLNSQQFGDTIIATIIYGDETHQSNQPYNRGTCIHSGRFPRINTAGCDAWASKIQSYCDADDPQCCKGFEPASHFLYPGEYDGEATRFVKGQFEKLK